MILDKITVGTPKSTKPEMSKKEKPGAAVVTKKLLLTLFNKDKLDRLSTKLDDCRSDLNNYILRLLNEKASQGFSDLNAGQKTILEAISLTRNVHETAALRDINDIEHQVLNGQAQHSTAGDAQELPVPSNYLALETHNSSRVHSEPSVHERPKLPVLRSEKPVAVVLRWSGGTSQTINLPTVTSADGRNRNDNQLIETAITFRNAGDNIEWRPNRSEASAISNHRPLEQTVLDTLHYSVLPGREGNISNAHQKTFEWIFDAKHGLARFLERENGCYWVTGKPGSGKSTAIKFIAGHNNTLQMLKSWAGDGVVTAAFFFWHSGTPI